jgi:hypothetical protein
MPVVLQLLTGALACGLLILVARRMGPARELGIYALSLVAAALIYVGFAAWGGAGAGWLMAETGGLLVFTLLAFAGLKTSARILALGWALHAGWDGLLHKLREAAFVPDWYPFACLAFDLLLAAYIAARDFRRPSSQSD